MLAAELHHQPFRAPPRPSPAARLHPRRVSPHGLPRHAARPEQLQPRLRGALRPRGPGELSLASISTQHSSLIGQLPSWVTNKLSSMLAPKMVKRLHKACLNYSAWKVHKQTHCVFYSGILHKLHMGSLPDFQQFDTFEGLIGGIPIFASYSLIQAANLLQMIPLRSIPGVSGCESATKRPRHSILSQLLRLPMNIKIFSSCTSRLFHAL